MQPQFIGPSYSLESRPAGVQRTVNMVPVQIEPGNERAGWGLEDVPGLSDFFTPAPAAITIAWHELPWSAALNAATTNAGTDSSRIGDGESIQMYFGLVGGADASGLVITAVWDPDDIDQPEPVIAPSGVSQEVSPQSVPGLFEPDLTTDGEDTIAPLATQTILSGATGVSYGASGVTLDPIAAGGSVDIRWTENKLDRLVHSGQKITYTAHAEFLATAGAGTGNILTFLKLQPSLGNVQYSWGTRLVSGVLHLYSSYNDGVNLLPTDHGAIASTADYSVVFDPDGATVRWLKGATVLRTEAALGSLHSFNLQSIEPGSQGVTQHRFTNARAFLGDAGYGQGTLDITASLDGAPCVGRLRVEYAGSSVTWTWNAV